MSSRNLDDERRPRERRDRSDRRDRRSRSRERSPSEKRGRSRSRSRESHRRRRRRHSSVPSSSGSSSGSSSSSGSESPRRHSSSKKHKKHKKTSDKKKKKTHKSDKKTKKHKKSSSSSRAVDQNEYGKYGILRESDFHSKSQSFQAWLRDIKKIYEFSGPKWEAMELFKDYMEDFNTATLPHEKYYDIEAYEMRKYHKEQTKKLSGKASSSSARRVVDEDALRREKLTQRQTKEQQEFKLILQTMNKDKIESMRRQELLRAEMQMHYKAGNVAEARRIEQLLKADEER